MPSDISVVCELRQVASAFEVNLRVSVSLVLRLMTELRNTLSLLVAIWELGLYVLRRCHVYVKSSGRRFDLYEARKQAV